MYSKASGISQILLEVSLQDFEDCNCPIEIESGIADLLLTVRSETASSDPLCKFMEQVSIRNQARRLDPRQSCLSDTLPADSSNKNGSAHREEDKQTEALLGSRSLIYSVQSKSRGGTYSDLSGGFPSDLLN